LCFINPNEFKKEKLNLYKVLISLNNIEGGGEGDGGSVGGHNKKINDDASPSSNTGSSVPNKNLSQCLTKDQTFISAFKTKISEENLARYSFLSNESNCNETNFCYLCCEYELKNTIASNMETRKCCQQKCHLFYEKIEFISNECRDIVSTLFNT
jgi:hypothetical protein